MPKPTSKSNAKPASDATELKMLQKEWQQLANPLEGVAKAKLGAAVGLESLTKALAKVPAGDLLQRGIEELRRKTELAISGERKELVERFRRIEARSGAGSPLLTIIGNIGHSRVVPR